MGIFRSETFKTLDDFIKHQVQDLYDAEHRNLEALPKMEERATHKKLKAAFKKHAKETEGQIKKLDRVFKSFGWEPERVTCHAAKGIVQEGQEVIDATGDDSVIDAALIAAAQRMEHYEIAGYGSLRAECEAAGHTKAVPILTSILEQEGATDEKLKALALDVINARAAAAAA